MARRARAGTGRRGDGGEQVVDLADRQGRLVRRRDPRGRATVAHPTPIRPCRAAPDNHATTGATSSRSRAASSAANAATFAERDRVATAASDAGGHRRELRHVGKVSPTSSSDRAHSAAALSGSSAYPMTPELRPGRR